MNAYTRTVKVWIDSDESLFRLVQAHPDDVENIVRAHAPSLDGELFGDLLELALQQVDWSDITDLYKFPF